MATGVVKMFNGERGFGFIKPDEGGADVFLHASALEQAGIGSLPVGSRVSFGTRTSVKTWRTVVGSSVHARDSSAQGH